MPLLLGAQGQRAPVGRTTAWPLCSQRAHSVPAVPGAGAQLFVHAAKEGADVAIVYLPHEQQDAEDTKKCAWAVDRGISS